jgi:hypothetical protein
MALRRTPVILGLFCLLFGVLAFTALRIVRADGRAPVIITGGSIHLTYADGWSSANSSYSAETPNSKAITTTTVYQESGAHAAVGNLTPSGGWKMEFFDQDIHGNRRSAPGVTVTNVSNGVVSATNVYLSYRNDGATSLENNGNGELDFHRSDTACQAPAGQESACEKINLIQYTDLTTNVTTDWLCSLTDTHVCEIKIGASLPDPPSNLSGTVTPPGR